MDSWAIKFEFREISTALGFSKGRTCTHGCTVQESGLCRKYDIHTHARPPST